MAYTTLNAGLAADLILVRGQTYYLTANITLGTYNVTTSGSSGRVTIKTDGTHQFQLDNTGTFVVDSIDFTSKNDDTKGDAIAGSSHTPAAGDQTVGYVIRTGTNTTALTISNFTVNYCTVSGQSVLGWTASSTTSTFTLTNGTLSNCAIHAAAATYSSFIGSAVSTTNGAMNLTNVSIDATCVAGNVLYSDGIMAQVVGTSTWNGVRCTPTGTMHAIAIVYTIGDGSVAITNGLFVGSVAVSTGIGVIRYLTQDGVITGTFSVANCIISNTGTGHGIMAYESGSTTLNLSVINSIITGCAGATAVGLARNGTPNVTHTYNDYYGNTTNAFEALTGSEITTNPALGNLPAGAVIDAAKCPFPNAYAASTTIQKLGSDTIANLGFNAAKQTATGYKYLPSDTITMGVQYTLTRIRSNSTNNVLYGIRRSFPEWQDATSED